MSGAWFRSQCSLFVYRQSADIHRNGCVIYRHSVLLRLWPVSQLGYERILSMEHWWSDAEKIRNTRSKTNPSLNFSNRNRTWGNWNGDWGCVIWLDFLCELRIFPVRTIPVILHEHTHSLSHTYVLYGLDTDSVDRLTSDRTPQSIQACSLLKNIKYKVMHLKLYFNTGYVSRLKDDFSLWRRRSGRS